MGNKNEAPKSILMYWKYNFNTIQASSLSVSEFFPFTNIYINKGDINS